MDEWTVGRLHPSGFSMTSANCRIAKRSLGECTSQPLTKKGQADLGLPGREFHLRIQFTTCFNIAEVLPK